MSAISDNWPRYPDGHKKGISKMSPAEREVVLLPLMEKFAAEGVTLPIAMEMFERAVEDTGVSLNEDEMAAMVGLMVEGLLRKCVGSVVEGSTRIRFLKDLQDE